MYPMHVDNPRKKIDNPHTQNRYIDLLCYNFFS